MKSARLVTLQTFSNELEAQVAKQHLESENVPASIVKDDSGGTYPWLQSMRGVDLKVRKEDLSKAKKVLRAMKV
jgi:hypothetical protein